MVGDVRAAVRPVEVRASPPSISADELAVVVESRLSIPSALPGPMAARELDAQLRLRRGSCPVLRSDRTRTTFNARRFETRIAVRGFPCKVSGHVYLNVCGEVAERLKAAVC